MNAVERRKARREARRRISNGEDPYGYVFQSDGGLSPTHPEEGTTTLAHLAEQRSTTISFLACDGFKEGKMVTHQGSNYLVAVSDERGGEALYLVEHCPYWGSEEVAYGARAVDLAKSTMGQHAYRRACKYLARGAC